MSAELIYVLEQLEKEKGIKKETIIDAIEKALIAAFKKNFGVSHGDVKVKIDLSSSDINFRVFAVKTVKEKPKNDVLEISLEDAKKINKSLEEGDTVEVEVTPRKFGRIAAQTAKQVVVQQLREAERGLIYEEFSDKEGDIVYGVIQRIEKKNVIFEIGRAEATLPLQEQITTEEYKQGDRMKTYVVEVKKTPKGAQILVSRTHPGLVKRLFELEVPEIHDGTVEIKSIAREAGSRTKIAVYSKDEDVDPIGACIGQKRSRIQAVVDELRGEKVDVIKWSSDPREYIPNSLSPAKVVHAEILENEKAARVVVPDSQLSLAIGKEGQNARLAAKLTGWKIDIKSEKQWRESIQQKLFDDSFIGYSEIEEDSFMQKYDRMDMQVDSEDEYDN